MGKKGTETKTAPKIVVINFYFNDIFCVCLPTLEIGINRKHC